MCCIRDRVSVTVDNMFGYMADNECHITLDSKKKYFQYILT